MLHGKKITVVMPAYNAAATLERTHAEVLAQGIVDEVIVVDDAGHDETFALAQRLPQTFALKHPRNRGYGGNQKTCYTTALDRGADIVIMIHPDYQYTPKLIPAMASLIASGLYSCALASRILGGRMQVMASPGQGARFDPPLYRYDRLTGPTWKVASVQQRRSSDAV